MICQLLGIYCYRQPLMSDNYYKVFEATVRGDDNALRRIRQMYGAGVFRWPGKDSSLTRTALEVACRHGYKDCLKELLDAYPISLMKKKGENPAVLAAIEVCIYLGRSECLDLLLSFGADPNKLLSESKGGPLHLVASRDHINCAIVLLKHNADVNLRNSTGVTPLHKAAQNMRLPCIRLLLQQGAHPDARTTEGFTPLHLIALDHFNLLSNDRAVSCLSVLLSCRDVDMNSQSNNGFTPLHMACVSPNVATAHMLLDYGASCRLRNNGPDGKLPIDCLPNEEDIREDVVKQVRGLRDRLELHYKGNNDPENEDGLLSVSL